VGIQDTNGHGQNIAHIIASHLEGKDYCMYIIKFSDGSAAPIANTVRSIDIAIDNNVDIINYSAGGPSFDEWELKQFKTLESLGIPFITSAGNESADLSKTCNFYPACYKLSNIYVVANMDKDGIKHPTSNFGKVDFWSYGVNQCFGGTCRTGTSQATGHVTGVIVARWLK
jgi:hypothetical protein